jgi:enolase
MSQIVNLLARQILDSRGRPTVEVDALLADGSAGRASVPSGASTGSAEAHELRDGDADRFAGLGVLTACANVNEPIREELRGQDADDQAGLDARMRALDGTPQLRRLGANAILAVSIAVCRAVATSRSQQLYQRIAELSGVVEPVLPLPMMNVLSGGLHAGHGMDVQDFLAVPVRAASLAEAVHVLARVRSAATEVARQRGLPTLLADEGGVSPGFATGREALQMMMQIFDFAQLRPGEDVVIAVDVAATALRGPADNYRLAREGKTLDSAAMIEMLAAWVDEFPIVSIEDGLAEEDWTGWVPLTKRLGSRVQLVGDDLFTTNLARLDRGVQEHAANGVLVKANQNGTLTGTLEVIARARAAGFATIVSARSGETEDAFMSDLAVGSAAGQIKIGSLRTSSTVAKYNQLLRIEEHSAAKYAGFTLGRTLRGPI